jgi:hypothetical protein
MPDGSCWDTGDTRPIGAVQLRLTVGQSRDIRAWRRDSGGGGRSRSEDRRGWALPLGAPRSASCSQLAAGAKAAVNVATRRRLPPCFVGIRPSAVGARAMSTARLDTRRLILQHDAPEIEPIAGVRSVWMPRNVRGVPIDDMVPLLQRRHRHTGILMRCTTFFSRSSGRTSQTGPARAAGSGHSPGRASRAG